MSILNRLKGHPHHTMLWCILIVVCTFINNGYAQDTTITNSFGSITFSSRRAYGFTVAYTSNISGANGYLFLRSRQPMDVNFLDQNLNQTLPQRGGSLGSAKVFQSSAPIFFNVREVVENTDYYFALVPYHLNGSVATFFTDSSTFVHIKSAAADPGNYYEGLVFTDSDILSQLGARLQNHTLVEYSDYKSTMVQTIFERDTVSGQKAVTCEYSNETKTYTGSFDFVALDYSREHLMPRSWMPTGGDFATPEGADYHNLALTNLGDANTLRSNFPFGEVVIVSDTFLECRKGQDANQNVVFEPRDEKKGDAARALFYQLICYNGKSGNWGIDNLPSYGNDQNVALLRNWHFNDLPDAAEKAKHEYIATLQGNRNPFIDYPDLADCIDFEQISKDGACPPVKVNQPAAEVAIKVYPNPATDVLYVNVKKPATITRFVLCDMTGRALWQQEFSVNESAINVPVADLAAGLYLGLFSFENGTTFCKKVEVVRP